MATSEFSIVGLTHKFLLAAERAGYTAAKINALAEDKSGLLKGFLDVLEGRAEITPIVRMTVVDLDAHPFVLEGWSVRPEDQLSNRAAGTLDLATVKIELHLAEEQKKGLIGGEALRASLIDQSVLNANVLDGLLANPNLIPEEWKQKVVFFWGTIYRRGDGDLYVRYLRWDGDRWGWLYDWLGGDWNSNGPAAVLASS